MTAHAFPKSPVTPPYYRYLGESGLKVPKLALGTMMFGGPTDEATAHRIIHKAKEQGFFFLDTADAYQHGRTEEIIGSAIRDDRDAYVLATEFANPGGAGPNRLGISRKWIIEAAEASLRRLGTDFIDILYFHRAFFDAPLGEAVRALADLVQARKVRYFGVSNFRVWRIVEVAHLADQFGIDRPVASQPRYNIVDRTAEVEQLPAARHYGLGVFSYSPLARDVLTGKYAPGAAPAADSRAGRGDRRILEAEWRAESIDIAEAIARHAAERGEPAATLRCPGCSITASSPRPSPGRAPRRSGTITSPPSTTASPPPTRRWSPPSCWTGTSPSNSTPIAATRWRAACRSPAAPMRRPACKNARSSARRRVWPPASAEPSQRSAP